MVNEGKQWIETSDVFPMFPTLVWMFTSFTRQLSKPLW